MYAQHRQNPMKFAMLAVLLLSSAVLFGCLQQSTGPSATLAATPTPEASLRVMTSFYPLQFFTQQIAGPDALIRSMVPTGVEPHEYEPTIAQLRELAQADVVIQVGLGFEPFLNGQQFKSGAVIVNATQGLELIPADEEAIEEGFAADPHVWLDPVRAKVMAQKIKEALVEADPQNAARYQTNLKALENRLDQLDARFVAGLSDCNQTTIITSHAAFAYMAQRYGFKQKPIAGLSPEAEPSPKELAELAEFAKANDVKFIYFEALIDPKLSETLAQEVGAQTLVLDPLEGVAEPSKEDYFSVMDMNLENLQVGLECTSPN